MKLDPRYYQISFQGLLLTLGVLVRDFSLQGAQFALGLASALLTQYLWAHAKSLSVTWSPSALITGMGLALLLRADNLWAHPLAAAIAISSKFLLRMAGRHLFNPAAFGLGAAILLLPGTWFSQGQWGSDLAIAIGVIALGATVIRRTSLQDASWTFLGAYLGLIALHLTYLGHAPERILEILAHRAANGGLLLFAFFMISDPMTLPKQALARRLHCLLVAALAFAWQFLAYQPHGPLWALLTAAPLILLWDRLYPGPKYLWHGNSPLQLRKLGTG